MSTPWENEPDSDSFEAAGLVCLMRRDHNGVWTGHVGLPKTHPLHGQRRDASIVVPTAFARAADNRRMATADLRGGAAPTTIDANAALPLSVALDVHGGLWSSGLVGSDYPGLWFFGFTCGHPWDFKPLDPLTIAGYKSMDPEQAEAIYRTPNDYRTYTYARNETEKLAAQLAALAEATLAGATT